MKNNDTNNHSPAAKAAARFIDEGPSTATKADKGATAAALLFTLAMYATLASLAALLFNL